MTRMTRQRGKFHACFLARLCKYFPPIFSRGRSICVNALSANALRRRRAAGMGALSPNILRFSDAARGEISVKSSNLMRWKTVTVYLLMHFVHADAKCRVNIHSFLFFCLIARPICRFRFHWILCELFCRYLPNSSVASPAVAKSNENWVKRKFAPPWKYFV